MQYTKSLDGLILSRYITVENALQSPQASVIRHELGEEITASYIIKSLAEACILTSSNLHPQAQAIIAKQLLHEYWHFKMDELFLVISEGIKGAFAEPDKPAIYGQLNIQTIFDWFRKYDSIRQDKIFYQHEIKKNSAGNQADRSPEPRLAKDVFEDSVDAKVKIRIDAYKRKAEDNQTH